MRKRVFGRKLSRGRKSRTALFRSLIRALVLNEKINTTKAKAKAIQGDLDKLITLAKVDTVSGRRNVLARTGNDREVAEAIYSKIAPAFKEKQSGFTRITPLPPRRGDMAQMVRIEWSQVIEKPKEIKAQKVEKVSKKTKTEKTKEVKEK